MLPFVLVTDSTIDETAAYFEKNDIKCAPLAFTIDDRTIEEDCGQTVSFHQFYDLLRQGKQASTSQAKLDTFLQIFRTALEGGQDILYIGFSSGLSGTYQAGCMARDELAPQYPDRRIFCIDSLSATGGEYLLVDKAREMRDSGCSAEVTAAAIEQMRLHVIHLITVDDLGHLHRGGRLSKTSAVVGGLLGIKPIIWVDDQGKLGVGGKVRGRQKAIQYLADRTLRELSDKNQTVRICHGDCPEDAQTLADLLLQRGVRSDIRYIGTVIGSHTGPGVLTTFFFGGDRKPQ
ncbi:MAG: DegV family protein [Agathobaculum desmolans]|uniref:DegV family protein n=1 Tax=Agathobaculum desmolans TaxID=39484 RepID=UPI00054D489F|nr:DegV family protein [Agathobaculum desmolans]